MIESRPFLIPKDTEPNRMMITLITKLETATFTRKYLFTNKLIVLIPPEEKPN